jgi:hypothetical protein
MEGDLIALTALIRRGQHRMSRQLHLISEKIVSLIHQVTSHRLQSPWIFFLRWASFLFATLSTYAQVDLIFSLEVIWIDSLLKEPCLSSSVPMHLHELAHSASETPEKPT